MTANLHPVDDAAENVRRLVAWNRQQADEHLASAPAASVRSVGIVGAGTMGIEIAAAHVARRMPVWIVDANEQTTAQARERIAAELTADRPGEAKRLVEQLVRIPVDDDWPAQCDLLLEVIVEIAAAKQQLYAQLEDRLAPGAIWASGTSTIPIGRLARRLRDARRFCGLHFCHPVRERPLVEIIRGPRTSDATIATAVAHVLALGRMPLVVGDCPGFVVNRLLMAHLGAALDLLLEGATVAQVDQAMLDFGMALGPLRLLDEIGLDTALRAALSLSEAEESHVVRSPLLVGMVKAGRVGRKSGGGFWTEAGQRGADEALSCLIAHSARPPAVHSTESIQRRLLLPILEATRICAEGVVQNPAAIDVAMIFGLGFPQHRGGLLWWADTLGLPISRELRYAGQ